MAFVLALPERKPEPADLPPTPREEVLRVAVFAALTQQIGNAVRHLGEAAEPASDAKDVTEAIHEARKSLKRIRSTLRLLQKGLGRAVFAAESHSFAQVARALTDTREAQVVDEVLQGLSRAAADLPAAPALSPAPPSNISYAEAVAQAQKAWQDNPRPATRFSTELRDQLLRELEEGRARLADCSLAGGVERALHSGLRRTVRRLKRAWKVARRPAQADKTAVRLHDLRKRVKDLFYMATLLWPAQPEYLGDLTAQLDELADLLGDDHDLTMLAERAHAQPEALGGPAVVTPLLVLAARRQHALRATAQPLADSLLGLKSRRFAHGVLGGLRLLEALA